MASLLIGLFNLSKSFNILPAMQLPLPLLKTISYRKNNLILINMQRQVVFLL
jgi:hypothetical protein